jgi:hypothetical protein
MRHATLVWLPNHDGIAPFAAFCASVFALLAVPLSHFIRTTDGSAR